MQIILKSTTLIADIVDNALVFDGKITPFIYEQIIDKDSRFR